MIDILREADKIIPGQRAEDYGNAEDSFKQIADLWRIILGVHGSPAQVALCMVQLKISRLTHAMEHEDSWIDAAGYLALGARMSTT